MVPEESAISVKALSKCFMLYRNPEDRLKQSVVPRLQRMVGRTPTRYFKEFWALKDVSFEVARGETVGIIGRNGAGKSTLLQIICGTLAATSGRAVTHGRVAALLELGSGFDPEFTGRENVFMYGSILGLSREEIDQRFEAIAAFADIGAFIDQPLKTYSSGMSLRLAFAVQAQIDPSILVVDEALAVGDARFQAKCFARLKELRDRGTSILLVTHSTEQIATHCDRAVLLEQGAIMEQGKPSTVINNYLNLLYGRASRTASSGSLEKAAVMPIAPVKPSDWSELDHADAAFSSRRDSFFSSRPAYNGSEYRWGDRRAEILDFIVVADGAVFPPTIKSGSLVTVYVRYRFSEVIVRPILGFTLKTKEGVTIYGTNTEMGDVIGHVPDGAAGASLVAKFEAKTLCGAGDYFLSVGVASRDVNGEVIPHDRRYDSIHLHVVQEPVFSGLFDFRAKVHVHALD